MYFSDLLTVLVKDLTCVLVCKNQEIFHLTFEHVGLIEEFIKKIGDSFRRVLNRDFKYLLLASSDAFLKFIDFLSAERARPSLAMEVCSYRTDGTFRTVKIELDQDYLVEVNKDNN